MLHTESLLKDLFEQDQWDRFFLFRIKPQIMKLENITDIPDTINALNTTKDELKGSDIFSDDSQRKINLLIDKLNKISEEKNVLIAAEQLNALKLEFTLFHDEKLDQHDKERRVAVSKLIPKIKNKTPEDYYYAAAIYDHGNSIDDYKQGNIYASEAKIDRYDDRPIAHKIREVYAYTHDRLQLTQQKPQEYGTTYAGKNDEIKGWKIGELVPPHKNYIYDRQKMDLKRNELGIKSLDEQEKDWGIKPKPIKIPTLNPTESRKTRKEKEDEVKPKPIVCGNCGEEGHFSGMCIRPKKR
jgi:hypothetical protein